MDRDYGRTPRLARAADRSVLPEPVPRARAGVLLRQVLLGATGLLQLVPGAVRGEVAVRRGTQLPLRPGGPVDRRSQPLRHLSGSAEFYRLCSRLRGDLKGLQHQQRGLPLGGGVAVRVQRALPLRARVDRPESVGAATLIGATRLTAGARGRAGAPPLSLSTPVANAAPVPAPPPHPPRAPRHPTA